MGQWVVTVAGIAILSVLSDIILPEGQTRKYIRTVFGIVVSLVIISPLVSLFSNGFSADIVQSSSVSAQDKYLNSVADRQNQHALNCVELLLTNKGVSVKNIELNLTGDKLVLELATVYSEEVSAFVTQVCRAYFPNAELVTMWGSV